MDPYASFPSNLHFYDASHPQTFSNAYHRHNAIPPAPYNSPRPILEDDRKLFDNFDRFLQGEINQKTFQAAYCKRLLFIWEWVLHLCFGNYKQALKTWYQLLGETEDEDIWLWVDGDEQQSQEWRLIGLAYEAPEGPTDLDPSCALSQANLKKAVEILRVRSQSHKAPASFPHWRRQLDACGTSYLRFMAVAFAIATSRPLRALDSDRGIKDRTVWSLLTNLEDQLSSYWQENTEAQPHQPLQAYVARLEAAGHTCTEQWRYDFPKYRALFELLELLDITSPDIQIQVHLPIFWPEHWLSGKYADEGPTCSKCRESGPLLLTDISWRRQVASGNPEALSSETLHTLTPKKYIHLLWWLWCTLSLEFEGNTGVLGDVDEWLQWLRLLALQPTVDIRENRDDHQAAHGPMRLIRRLLSQKMEEYLHSDYWNECFLKPYLGSNSNICGFSDTFDSYRYIMYLPSSKEWKTAEDIFSRVAAAWYGNSDFVDVQSVCGVLAWWAMNGGVTSHLPDYYSFLEVTRFFDDYRIFIDSQPDPQEELISRIQKDKPKCCGNFNKRDLDWYLASASLLLPESAITKELVWRCRCIRNSGMDEVFRLFDNYSTMESQWPWTRQHFKGDCGRLLDRMIDTAQKYGVKPAISEDGRGIVAKPGNENPPTSHQPETENRLPFRFENLGTAELQEIMQAAERELQRQAPLASPVRTLSKGDVKTNKSAQVKHIKQYLVDLLQELENSTLQILELVPRGKQKGSHLPWKNLPQILLDRGYEFENWPRDVPVPGSGSTLCDDNKGIHGLNAKHLRALYDATQSTDYPLGFRKVSDGVSAQARLEEAAMRGRRRGRDEDSDVGEMQAGPSKRSRPSA